MGAEQPWDIILGDVFLMTQLVVFDVADPNGSVDSSYPSHGQIGFAPKPAQCDHIRNLDWTFSIMLQLGV